MYIIGISAFYHDSAAVLIREGEIVAAAQEERFNRKKHHAGFPHNAIQYCLTEAGIDLADVEKIVFYDKPFLKFERLLETYLQFAPRGFSSFRKAIPVWLKEKLFQKENIIRDLKSFDTSFISDNKLLFSEHHHSHAASAFFPSPFEEAIILTMDGVGEWATSSVAIGKNNSIEILKEIHFPHSLGLLYSAFTQYTGFKVNSGEYKLMGLAPYGSPIYKDVIEQNLIDIKPDGSFRLNMKFFDYCTGLSMVNQKFCSLFGKKIRSSETDPIEKFHMDIAASIQSVTEEIILKLARSLRKEYRIGNLCLAGGVALNCVANGKIIKENIFDNVWVQPAAGDAGGSLGAALSCYYEYFGKKRFLKKNSDSMKGAFLGPSHKTEQIENTLKNKNAVFFKGNFDQIIEKTAHALAEGNAVGWMQGRMEFGPRALGNRSILASPLQQENQRLLNLKIKFRESFRPFAPAILCEDVKDWFELNCDSPYMLFVAKIKEIHRNKIQDGYHEALGFEKLKMANSKVPAVTHVDFSSRIQTVHKETNPLFYQLISKFKEITGCPILINTSFNVRGEPIVESPADALNCFMGTGLDHLAIGEFFLSKENQKHLATVDYKRQFELD